MSVPCVMYFYKTLALLILTANSIFAGKVNLIVCFHSVDEAGIVELEKKYDLVRVYFSERLKTGHYCTDSDIDKLIEELSASGIVKFAEKNSELSLNSAIIDSYINQYHLNNPNGPDINWLNADSYSQKHSFSEEPIIIAVIDTGFTFGLGSAFNNNDLLVNLNDPVNGIDDDGNGYVDDYLGWDFSQNDNDVSPELTSTKFNHGNKVASMIFGEDQIAGFTNIIADQNIKLLPLKVGYINDVGEFRIYTSNWIIAAEYAMDMGAHIINLSLGGGVYKYSAQLLIDTLENEDVLVVVSAGNDANNNDIIHFYPASYPNENIISVASIQQDGELSDFSNFGASSVDIAAPGTQVWAYDPSNTQVKILYDPNFDTIESFNTWTYGSLSGNLSAYNWDWAYDYVNNRGYLHDGTGSNTFYFITPYQSGTNNWLESEWLDLDGIKNPKLNLKIDHALNLSALDYLSVEITTEGTNYYTPVSSFMGSRTNYIREISLDAYAGQNIKIRFKLRTFDTYYGGVRIVDLNISGAVNYAEVYGTSYSAPLVAGIAALMKSLDPTLSASEIREIIIKTATPQVPLEGKVVSGGVLDSYDALHAVHNASKLYYSFNLSNWFHLEDAFNGSLYGNLSFRDFENFKIFINSVSKNPDDTHRLALRYYGKNKTDGGDRALIRNFTINNSSEFFLKIVDY
jgi:subtilisin family serine protease